jgi:2-polyprenyl-6-methoxyphenol hydroxylase-like FAD-dependent oxidoreductase
MNPAASPRVLIAGAGPTGLTLACELARRGIPFRIIDAALEPFTGSRGKGLQPRTLEVLDDLGVIDRVLASGCLYPRLRLHWRQFTLGHWSMFEQRAPTPEVPYPNTWLIPQWRTEEILHEQLTRHGHAVELGTELTGFQQDDAGVTATLAHARGTEALRVEYLVGADGGHSRVRKALGVGFHGKTHEDERMVVGDVKVEGLDREHWHVWPMASGGVIALCPLPGTDRFQLMAQVKRAEEVPALTEREVQQRFQHAARPGAGVRLHDPSWLSLYRSNVRMVDRYRVGRVFLAGDAAHVHPPAGGQGLNTGVQDAYNLGWKLGHVLAGAPAALLDTYEEERRPIAASVLGMSSRLYTQATRNGLRPQRRGAEAQQLGLSYRGGSLAREAPGGAGGLRAGDRAPDAPCVDAAGRPVRLFDAFRGPHWTLLAFGPNHADTVAWVGARFGGGVRAFRLLSASDRGGEHDLIDAGGHARAGYGLEGNGLALIRPDGYVGLISRSGTCAQLEEYLGPLAPEPARSFPGTPARRPAAKEPTP